MRLAGQGDRSAPGRYPAYSNTGPTDRGFERALAERLSAIRARLRGEEE